MANTKIELLHNTFRWKRCPSCASGRIYRRGDISYQECPSFSSHPVALECSPELWQCRDCKSWFSQNIVPQETAFRLYAEGASSEKWSRTPFTERKPAEVVEALSELFSAKVSVLDIGCNTGEFLDFAKSRGCETAGIEPSVACQSILENKGHRYFPSLSSLQGKRFDIITAFDLIEHLYDIHAFLDFSARSLNEKGILVVCTGDISSLSARISRSMWWYVSAPEHIIFPSKSFFYNLPDFKVTASIRTYASAKYRQSLSVTLKGFIKGIVRNKYNGLPSLGPDHILLFLSHEIPQ